MPIIWIGIALIVYWLLAIYSVSIHESFTLTLKLIDNWSRLGEPSNYFYFLRQLKNIAIAIIVSLWVYIIPLKFFQKNKNIIIIWALLMILQLLVFIPWVWIVLNGARWRISLPGFPTIQPAEIFKIWYILFLSYRLLKRRDIINQKQFYIHFIVINIIVLFVFLLIPDLWTLLILWATGILLARYAWAKAKYMIYLLIWWMIGWLVIWSIAGLVNPKFAYIQRRFTYFINPSVDEQKKWVWWQNEQALMAVGWWWIFGKWYGKWLQKFWYLPEAQSDFIFAAYSEELGFIGNMILLWLYFYLIYYFLSRLYKIKNEHNKMIWVGIISIIVIQAFVNIGVNIKLLPNTGITLPFISYWWTALMVNCIEIILLYKILKEK